MLITGPISGLAPYKPSGVQFTQASYDLGTGIVCNSATVADTGVISQFFWYQQLDFDYNGYQVVWVVDPDNLYDSYFYLERPSQTSEWECADIDENNFVWEDFHLPTIGLNWHWVLWSAEINLPTGQKRSQIIIDGNVLATNFFDSDNEVLLGINGRPVYFMDDSFQDSIVGNMSDYWLSLDVSLLDISGNIPLAMQERFVKSGRPRNPSGFPGTAAFLFSGDASTWPNNQGSGGATTLYGGPLVTVPGPAG